MTALPTMMDATADPLSDDPAQWPWEIREIPLTHIRIDPANLPRLKLSPPRVRDLAQIIREQGTDTFPPIVVGGLEEDGCYPLGDGWYRVEAARLAGAATLRAAILPGATPGVLFAIAVRFSAKAATTFTNREKRRVVLRLLAEFPGLSVRALADLAGTSHEFVAQRKRDQERGRTEGARPRAPRSPEYHWRRLLAEFDALGATIQKPEDLRRVQQALATVADEQYGETDPARELDVLSEWARSTAALMREGRQLRVA